VMDTKHKHSKTKKSSSKSSSKNNQIVDDSNDIAMQQDDRPIIPQSDYQCLTIAQLLADQNKLIDACVELLCVPRETCHQLLSCFKWNKDTLEEKYFEDSEALLQKAGIINPEIEELPPIKSGNHECTICLCDYPAKQMQQLNCGHVFCQNCMTEFVATKLDSFGAMGGIRCPQRKCNIMLDPVTIEACLVRHKDKSYVTKLKKFLLNSYVQDNDHMKWCPGKNCENVVRVTLMKSHLVSCKCGCKFCFSCGNLPHPPATCMMMKNWEKKNRRSDERSDF
jgi:ariadne-1